MRFDLAAGIRPTLFGLCFDSLRECWGLPRESPNIVKTKSTVICGEDRRNGVNFSTCLLIASGTYSSPVKLFQDKTYQLLLHIPVTCEPQHGSGFHFRDVSFLVIGLPHHRD